MSEPLFHTLVIDGVGLLGGSLGMALRAAGLVQRVIGLGRSTARLELARQSGAIDEGRVAEADQLAAVAEADALILATPPCLIVERIEQFAPRVRAGAFVTDVGSIKGTIVAAGERHLAAGVRFVGSHPMAGSEKTGVEHARRDFYDGCACLITPTERTDPAATDLARRMWQALGARTRALDPERHDRLLAGISHLPHVLAPALLQMLIERVTGEEELLDVAGGGLRDLTRIAAADPEIWRQILTENAPAVRECLDAYIETLRAWRAALDDPPDGERITQLFRRAGDVRRRM